MLGLLVAMTSVLTAGEMEAFDRAMEALADDPPIAAIQEAALRHFAVNKDEVEGYRTAARLQGLLPELSTSLIWDDSKGTFLGTDQAVFGQAFDPDNPQIYNSATGLGRAFSASAAWNLSSLVFNQSELDAYALVGIYEDLVKEVTRLYYSRQHNILAMLLDPPADPRAKAALVIRTRESEALLDALTGGAFSKLKKKK